MSSIIFIQFEQHRWQFLSEVCTDSAQSVRSALGPVGHCKLLHPKHIFISLANVGFCQETTQRGILVIRETKREDLGAYVQGFIYYSRWLCGVKGALRKAARLSKKHMESSCYLVRRLRMSAPQAKCG